VVVGEEHTDAGGRALSLVDHPGVTHRRRG
jgi:hypothetical protein